MATVLQPPDGESQSFVSNSEKEEDGRAGLPKFPLPGVMAYGKTKTRCGSRSDGPALRALLLTAPLRRGKPRSPSVFCEQLAEQ
jgi:hypothetical protein